MTIERAAKAIWKADGGFLHGEFDPKDAGYLNEARAALDAIAEPTPEMVQAGMNIDIGRPGCDWLTREEVRVMWRAMHAAMMKETK